MNGAESLNFALNVWAVIGALSGVVAIGLYTRYKVEDHAERISKLDTRQDEHEDDDMLSHQRVLDRLARIETKIDVLMGHRSEE